ncbi:MAG: DUF4097 family beta strand repeat protein, partial [Chloroflexi bacterium]|nr:DUF4097 family beta strand repeat protein [Chloroflexota bacterium]
MMSTAASDPQPEPGAGGSSSDARFEQTFPTGDHCRLVLDNPRGRIHVTGWDRPEVHVQARKLGLSCGEDRVRATRIVAEHQDDAVTVRTIFDLDLSSDVPGPWRAFAAEIVRSLQGLLPNKAMPAEVVYTVQVPRSADLELTGVSSDVVVEEVRGTVHARTVSGSVALERVQGDLHVSVVSGNATGHEVGGKLEARSVSGDLRFAGQLETVQGNAVSGSIEVESPLDPAGSYDFQTVSGDVSLRAPPETGASISARGVSVDVICELPHRVERDERRPGSREWQGSVQDGGAPVRFRTVSGRLRMRPTPPPSLSPLSPPSPLSAS